MVVEKIVTGFLRQGHQVVLITLGKTKKIEHEKSLTIYRISPWNLFSFIDIGKRNYLLRSVWHIFDTFSISGYWTVKKILDKEQPSLVMTHNLKGIGFTVPKAIRKAGIKHIHTVHDVQLSRPSGIIFYGEDKPFLIIDKIYEKAARRLFGSPDMVVSPSRWLLDFYRRLGFFQESKYLVLPNPIIFQKGYKTSKSKLTKGVRFLFVGQLEKFKGINFLIEACKQLKGDWSLKIVGEGHDRKSISKLINVDGRFEMTGWLDRKQIPLEYQQADLTVVPSLCYENSPTVIYESLVANVPVVAADIGGVAELVKDDYNGFTFAAGNKDSLVEVLQHFVDHPQSIEKLKKNCFVSVREYGVDQYVKKLISVGR